MRCNRISSYVIFTLFIGWFFLGAFSCSSLKLSPAKQSALVAYERAKSSLIREQNLEVDVLWLLQNMLQMEPDMQLEQVVNNRLERISTHPYLLMVKPNAARIELPPDPGKGIDRYFVYIQSAFGYPEMRAAKYVVDYVSKKETGYILTHQYQALLWSEQTGLKLPIDIEARKLELLDEIQAEQLEQGPGVCVDLYAERVALLLRYGHPAKSDIDKWVDTLVAEQREDGTWPASKPAIEYDGEKALSTIPPSHTTAWVMLALKCYLLKY